jgi:glyoxylase-like metal-dependent hydrolase (beta-lactamase superfamily II)
VNAIIEHFAVGPLACNCTIIGERSGADAIVIDPGEDAQTILTRIGAHGLRVRHIIHTHAHFDHVGATAAVREATGARTLLHPGDLPLYRSLAKQAEMFGVPPPVVSTLDADLRDGDVLNLGALRIEILHTPGHTPGSCSFALHEGDETHLFTGDTMFRGAVGRWDIGGTSLEDIVASIRAKLLVYPDATVVIPGHGPATTVGFERDNNPFL